MMQEVTGLSRDVAQRLVLGHLTENAFDDRMKRYFEVLVAIVASPSPLRDRSARTTVPLQMSSAGASESTTGKAKFISICVFKAVKWRPRNNTPELLIFSVTPSRQWSSPLTW